MQGAIWSLLLSLNLSEIAWAAKKIDEPVIKDLGEIGGAHFATGFSSLSEYRDWISTFVVVILFAAREYYQFRKDRETVEKLRKGQENTLTEFAEIRKSQTELALQLTAFIKAADKAEERMDRRVERIERVMDDR